LAPAQLQAGRDIIERVVGARGTTEPARIDARTGLTHAQIEALQAQAAADRLKRQIQADVSVALEAFKTSSEQSRQTQSELVRLASAAEQETLWRYNGMLASTWQLLASARHRMEAVEAALQARRQAWHAYLDLQAVLAGLPYNGGLDLASSGASGSPKEGH
jgi:outer membrane protein TolC